MRYSAALLRRIFFELHQVRKRLFALDGNGSNGLLLKYFNGESAPEQKDLPTRGCPLYIAGLCILAAA